MTLLRTIPTMTFQKRNVTIYDNLIVSCEGKHTTHVLNCVRFLSTSQTDWRQSRDILSDVSFTLFLTIFLAYLLTFCWIFFLTYLVTFFLTSSDICLTNLLAYLPIFFLTYLPISLLTAFLTYLVTHALYILYHFVWCSFWHIFSHPISRLWSGGVHRPRRIAVEFRNGKLRADGLGCGPAWNVAYRRLWSRPGRAHWAQLDAVTARNIG